MLRLRLFLSVSVLSLLVIHSGYAQSKPEVPSPIKVYESIWDEALSSEERMKLINSVWLEESTYEDPSVAIKGTIGFNKMVEGFFKTFPGATMESGSILLKDRYCTWSWKIFDANKKLIVAGRDFAELNTKGQILMIIGFFEQPSPQP